MKEPEQFRQELDQAVPLPGDWFTGVGPVVTEYELEQDGQSFVAFASMLGVSPPGRGQDVRSSPSS